MMVIPPINIPSHLRCTNMYAELSLCFASKLYITFQNMLPPCYRYSLWIDEQKKGKNPPLCAEDRDGLYLHCQRKSLVIPKDIPWQQYEPLCDFILLIRAKAKHFVISINIPPPITYFSILTCFLLPQFFTNSTAHLLPRSHSSR